MRSQSAPVRDSGASPDIAFNRSACNAIVQFPNFSFSLAGEEGFEPPHPVLQTGGLPLNLLPFTLSSRRWRVRRADSIPLLHFTVCSMLSARIAELFGFHSIGMLLLILCCCVVPILAIIAQQRDDFAHSAGPFLITR